jgi:hypothetical protein
MATELEQKIEQFHIDRIERICSKNCFPDLNTKVANAIMHIVPIERFKSGEEIDLEKCFNTVNHSIQPVHGGYSLPPESNADCITWVVVSTDSNPDPKPPITLYVQLSRIGIIEVATNINVSKCSVIPVDKFFPQLMRVIFDSLDKLNKLDADRKYVMLLTLSNVKDITLGWQGDNRPEPYDEQQLEFKVPVDGDNPEEALYKMFNDIWKKFGRGSCNEFDEMMTRDKQIRAFNS